MPEYPHGPEQVAFARAIAETLQRLDDLHQTLMVHPDFVPAVNAWLKDYEWAGLIAVMPNPAVPRDKIFVFPTKIVSLPAWLPRAQASADLYNR